MPTRKRKSSRCSKTRASLRSTSATWQQAARCSRSITRSPASTSSDSEELPPVRPLGGATTLGRRWRPTLFAAVGNTGFDYLALLCALRAVGAAPRPSLVMLAYASAELLAQIPFTPGGLGFVEAGLVGTLTLAGVPGPAALATTLLYRLVSYWLPIPVDGVAYLLFRRRY